MESTRTSWFRNHQLWLEAFVRVNLAFLAPDIYVAHSTNLFRHGAEYIPFFFSEVAPLVLLAALLAWKWQPSANIWRLLGYFVGWSSVAIGIVGLIFHLESRFFREETLESLVYAAPFSAPLAYTGIGLLLIMNRMVDAESADWPYWVLFLALGGFVGNFIFCLTDHAQIGYGAPAMAPLLFPNLVLLAFLGLWVLRRQVPESDEKRRSDAPPLSLQRTDT